MNTETFFASHAVSRNTTAASPAVVLSDPRSLEVLARAARIARSDASVLIQGETGTGKELIARHIHEESGRTGPFVAVNCGAFSEHLIDAELFGHEAGAFTGALRARAGWFEAANGGTLFLDEIGDLPLALQVKLLRVLQERQVVRVGSRQSIPIHVRLIAATNMDLLEATRAQRFRADLYYRLSVATVQLPALRERPGDILPLAHHFLRSYGARLHAGSVTLAPDAQALLSRYTWPGNVRELENVIHYAVIIAKGSVLHAEHFPIAMHEVTGDGEYQGLASSAPDWDQDARTRGEISIDKEREAEREDSLHPARPAAHPCGALLEPLKGVFHALTSAGHDQLLHQVEATLVRTAFDRCAGNQVHTARCLGVSRNVLRTLLKRHGLLKRSQRGQT